jgi:hypothetical protein
MVAIIKTGTSISRTIAYHENKVKAGVAELIWAGNYPVDLDKISHEMKIKRFTKRTELNKKAKHNTVHVSLNFSPLENHTKETLISIATYYIEKIGFSHQPYLLYQHYDSGHPHLHLVTINIEKDGKRIDLHNIVTQKSEPARKQIEEFFGLIKAQKQNKDDELNLSSLVMGKILYGKMESKKAITQVLNFILNRYNYTSLCELNAVLGQYNLLADRGKENSKTFQSGGLLYRILAPQGKPIGVPMKASALDGQPTLKFLEAQFKINAAQNTAQKRRIKNIIALSLQRHPNISQHIFFKMLQRQAITAIEQKNSFGIDEIIYIDQKTKCVFSNEALELSYDIAPLKKNNTSLEVVVDKKKLTRKNHRTTYSLKQF